MGCKIHRVRKSPFDQGNRSVASPAEGGRVDGGVKYNDLIVKKPWGYEYLVFENEHVAIWLLQIIRKRRTSMHCHPRKRTGLVLLAGNATCSHVSGSIELDVMDAVMIDEGAFHSTEASNSLPIQPQSENGIWVMEIESPPLKTDLVRMDDAYGRAGAGYEGEDHMVHIAKECLKFEEPSGSGTQQLRFLNYVFTIKKGTFRKGVPDHRKDALVTVIGKKREADSSIPCLAVNQFMRYEDFCEQTRKETLEDYTLLIIEKEVMLTRVSDYIFSFIADLGVKEVFVVSGGAAMHLLDSLGRNENLRYVTAHHEQAAAMAAEAYARMTGKPGAVLVTSGPGGTNTITGLCGAWIDSIPVIYVSGQVITSTLIGDTGLRQFGIQESNIAELVRPITKYAMTVKEPETIKHHLQKALHLATTGRPGPVWLDIPLDVQSRMVRIDELSAYVPDDEGTINLSRGHHLDQKVAECLEVLKRSSRPVLIIGHGIRLARAEKEILPLVERLKLPVVSSWNASDLIPTEHDLYVGRSGIMGDRASNFTVQNADALLVVGSRMSIPQVGYNPSVFAREARIMMVDVDEKEFKKPSIHVELPILADAREFILALQRELKEQGVNLERKDWLAKCREWKRKYPVILPEYKENQEAVNSFHFIDVLSQKLDEQAVVVTDMGTSFTCTMQTFRTKRGQRLFTSSGHASMGFGLPGAIGACFGAGRRKVICISGDGGLQMNIQELQTLVHYRLPITLFVLNNSGYLTIKLMQQNHFGRYVGSESGSGVSCPDIVKVALAYGIAAERIATQPELLARIDEVLAKPGPYVCEIMMPENQPLIPRVSSLKKPDGTVISKPLEDLYPFLPRPEFKENMIVKPIEVLE